MPSSSDKKRFVDILLPYPVGRAYTYADPDLNLTAGDFVLVPMGRRQSIGVVWSEDAVDINVPAHKIKSVLRRFETRALPKNHRAFLQWVASYAMADVGSVLKMSLPKMIENSIVKPPKKPDVSPCAEILKSQTDFDLSQAQAKGADVLCKAVAGGTFQPIVLDGVTGSGKTEVYFEALAKSFEMGRQALVLLPEIGLSTAFLKRFEKRFGTAPAVWHSDVTPAQKRKIWHGVLKGETKCVVGARSSLFLPFQNLGVIVVDEEHDASYKQEDGVMYNARDMAIVRAKIETAPIVLTSATPALETMENIWSEKYDHVVLPERFGTAVMPDIHLIDMRAEKTSAQQFLSDPLRLAIKETIERGEQSLLFLNRRGYAPLTLCRKCGYRFECDNCTAWLVEHRSTHKLHCHHCGFEKHIPKECPDCEMEESLVACGPGVERIAEEISALLPEARVMTLSSDMMQSPKRLKETLEQIENGTVDVIIGTQMIAKGHHFPMLTTVGIVDADIGLSGGDLRAAERTFQLLQQVSGRAGRSDLKGRVYIQSYMPDHTVMQAIVAGDRDAFLRIEASERQEATMPPYGKLAALIITGKNEAEVKKYCYDLARAAPRYDDLTVLGPTAAMMSFLRGKHRWRFLLRGGKKIHVQKAIEPWVASVKRPSSLQLKIDIDPQSFF